MSEQLKTNRRIVLASRPHGEPVKGNLRLETVSVPAVREGEVLLKTIYLSLDPYMRGRMSDAPSYAAPVQLGEVMVGGTISRVIASKNPDFQEGDVVLAASGWQDYAVSDGKDLLNLGQDAENTSLALGIMGMPGFTGYMGLLDIGKPKAGETLVVGAATGPVGSVVGQVGKIKGCRVVGIAGGKEKCRYAVEKLGFDVCLDHKAPDFASQLAQGCPDGIDIYYENVGGKVFDAVLPLLNTSARIPLCGLVSGYNSTGELPAGPDRLPLLLGAILTRRLTIRGFIIFNDYTAEQFAEFRRQMGEWIEQGKIHHREYFVDGLETAPEALVGLLRGDNFGKMVVRVE
ncbi:MAG: Alcohol dehydrogenase zinc-binding domain-containing protein [Candidatus Tokpelaia hoelldobleri]|uniref:Alcohol dehydrogenase zinc-binding domain-containing protein n=1 Tax=Candidatus Tokpelaia hoelldobleri TaxID=1902579 RepID=A0A1U9JU32_9HYPH|nr:MAG: Alcohol dehydrogenase zinc-binding domain-containing protein [Candidatus Tokpelaia hoelldoblerii]